MIYADIVDAKGIFQLFFKK